MAKLTYRAWHSFFELNPLLMNVQTIDRQMLKTVVLELMTERKDFFKGILREILAENQIIVSKEQAERRARLEGYISEDFEKYDEVFKALA